MEAIRSSETLVDFQLTTREVNKNYEIHLKNNDISENKIYHLEANYFN
jgi:hypothetical protein